MLRDIPLPRARYTSTGSGSGHERLLERSRLHVAHVLRPAPRRPVLALTTSLNASDSLLAAFICAATVAALTSGAIGYHPRRSPVAFVAYAVTTGALAALSIGVLIALVIAIECGDSSDCL
jgi:hypothetical protein